jgi:microcystin-dependent protein
MAPQTLGQTGGGQPHENRQPTLALNYVIALVGIFPSRS